MVLAVSVILSIFFLQKVTFLEVQVPDPMKVLHKMVVEGESNDAVNTFLDVSMRLQCLFSPTNEGDANREL